MTRAERMAVGDSMPMPRPAHDFDRNLVVYTDGACSGNPGPGGWAWAEAPDGVRRASGGESRTTNQRMELHAVLDALRVNVDVARKSSRQLVIVSDSTYVVKCFTDRWWVKWTSNGWLTSKREPVANDDIWKPLIAIYEALPVADRPRFEWVKGHSGDPMNDLVDRLAVAGCTA